MIRSIACVTLLLSTVGCESPKSTKAAESVVDCAKLRAMIARFNTFDAAEQEHDLAVTRAIQDLPHPVGIDVRDSMLAIGASGAGPATIRLTSGGCELVVTARSPRVEAMVRNE
ncbi:hypothetical protein HZY97_05385 [Sphingomonas sp. R-74633]|uniref:hypothetical protein n=1 Tax=Sphingomonas sp. R-74633 TaxID=2751188 RepID=UPI0015D22325|nr:hypothetical protein [Sphingomonas sp. R-74633]NYT40178.1 hypothetical protein [Sphingomonas sp. R-74633]